MPIRDDDGRYALYIRPFEGRPVTTYVDEEVLNKVDAFNKTIREPESKMLLDAIGREYYQIVMDNPRKEAGILTPKSDGVDLSRITDVNIRGDRYHRGSFVMFATIDGERQATPVRVTSEQAERSWLSGDRETYNKMLAAELFKDRLAVAKSEGQAEGVVPETEEKIVESEVKNDEHREEPIHRPFRR